MASHTQNPEDSRTTRSGTATYGDLLTHMRSELDAAITSPNGHPLDVQRAHAEILGYERFLRVSGHHLTLLAFLAQTESAAWRTLGDRLAQLPTWESSTGHWSQASVLLGAAHDLVATHVGPDRTLRTPDIEDLAGGPELKSSASAMLERLEVAALAGDDLLDRIGRRQKRVKTHLTTACHYSALRSASRAIAVYGRAARWDLREARQPSAVDHLQSLEAAPLPRFRPAPQFEDCLEALRVLRYVVRAQAHGEVPASPISLRDLALLGARVTDPEQLAAPNEGASPVHRLEHAHLKDQLAFAHETWTQLAEHLLTHTQGLTKAPREYAFAVEQLNRPLDPVLRAVVARALPDLGRRAGDTVRQLAAHNALVTPQREPGAVQAHWRPVTGVHRETLAELFAEAGAAPAAAADPGSSAHAVDSSAETAPLPSRTWSQGYARTNPVQR